MDFICWLLRQKLLTFSNFEKKLVENWFDSGHNFSFFFENCELTCRAIQEFTTQDFFEKTLPNSRKKDDQMRALLSDQCFFLCLFLAGFANYLACQKLSKHLDFDLKSLRGFGEFVVRDWDFIEIYSAMSCNKATYFVLSALIGAMLHPLDAIQSIFLHTNFPCFVINLKEAKKVMENHSLATSLKSLNFCGDDWWNLFWESQDVSKDFKAHGSTILCQENSNFYVEMCLLISWSLYFCLKFRFPFIILSFKSDFVSFQSLNSTDFC